MDSDALLIAGFAGGFLGMACLGTGRGGLFGASLCFASAALCITRTATRSDDRVRSLESAFEACVTDLAKLDGRFTELHDDTAIIASRVDWVAENAGAAGKKACCIEIGLQNLRRQDQAYESWFATQIARVDHLVAALHEGHFGAGATLADSHRTIMRLVGLVEGCEAHLLSISALRLCFGSWAGAFRSAQLSAFRILEYLRYWLRAWHLACAISRGCAAATQV